MSTYVIRVGDVGFHLVGPFATAEAASAWASGERHGTRLDGANNPHDDPRWQLVELTDTTTPVIVVHSENVGLAATVAASQEYGLSNVNVKSEC